MFASMKVKQLKKILLALLVLLVLYLSFKPQKLNASFNTQIKQSKPHDVWEFVSDLNNAKLLNPAIYDFEILDDKGNFKHWEYNAIIYETMQHLPLITNANHAHFIVKPDVEGYRIIATYNTCFFRYFCLKTATVMSFTAFRDSTSFTEDINYECPSVLKSFCAWELNDQRQKWMENLRTQFVQ